MKRAVIGFVVRLILATIIGGLSWYSCVSLIGSFPRLQSFACFVIGAPVVAVERYGSWCDFCSPDELMWNNLRIAVPIYILLLYIPVATRWSVRRVREKLSLNRTDAR